MKDSGGEPVSQYRWVVMALLAANAVSGTLLFVSLGLLLPAMLQDIAMTPAQQGWLSSSQLLGTAALAIPAAWWFSRFNARAVAAAANLAGALLALGQAAAPGYLTLLAARTGYGLTTLAGQPAATLLVRQWFPDREIALVNGLFMFAIGIGEFAAAAGAPVLLDLTGGWRSALALMDAWALAAALLWLTLGRERLTTEPHARQTQPEGPPIWSVVRHRELWLPCIGTLGTPAAWAAFGTFWPGYMQQTHGIPLATLGVVYGLISLGQAPAGLLFGFLDSRWDVGRSALIGCGAVMALFSAVMLLSDSVLLLTLAGVMVGVSWGFVPIIMTIPYRLPGIAPREIAVATSLISSTFALGAAVGPVATGLLIEVSGSALVGLGLMCITPLSLTAAGFGLPRRKVAVTGAT